MNDLKKLGALLFALLFLFGCGCETIDTGHVGVVKRFGAIQPSLLPEGFATYNPFTSSILEISVQNGATATEAMAASKDLQTVHTKVTIQWSIAQEKVLCIVQKFGVQDGAWTNGIIEPAVQEVVKAVSARYTAEELITKRSEVKLAIEAGLNDFIGKTLKSRGCDNGIHISNVAVTNFEFSKEFNDSIEAKVKAEQDSLRAENEKRTRVTQAEAKAAEQKLAAEANAYTTEVESKTRAAAIERESKALESNPNLIQLRIAERWDGKLPTYTGNSIPMLQLEKR